MWILHTLDCNLRCRYCYTRAGKAFERFISSDRIDVARLYTKAIDILYSTFEREIRFTTFYGGGEPLLDFGTIKYVIEHVEREGYGYMYSIVTNGTLLRKEIIEYLKAHNVLLTISMDGSRLINDLNRVKKDGKGTFDDLIKVINTLRDLDYDFDIEATYTAEAYKLGCTPKDTVEYLSTQSPFIILLQIETHMKTLEGDSYTPPLDHLLIDLIDASFHEFSQQKPRYYYLSVILALAMFSRKAIKTTICPFTTYLTIYPNGDVTGCHVIPSLILGNVKSEQLQRNLLSEMEKSNEIRYKLTELLDERHLWLVTLQDMCPGQIFNNWGEIITYIESGKKVHAKIPRIYCPHVVGYLHSKWYQIYQ